MDFRLGRINLNAVAQGVGGLVFGNDNSSTLTEDSQVERLLDCISNGVLAEDRRAAVTELQLLVTESRSAQLAIGAMGFPVLLSVLKEETDDVEIIRGALETLVSALTPIDTLSGQKNEIQPVSINSDLLSQEKDSISLLLSLLSEDDFYVRYYTLQLLTALLTHSPNRLQDAILSIPRGITSLVDMLMDREVIRNEALLLLTYLTREAEEIQKILVFEGAFEKIFSIIKEEGGSDGGVVVQDCLELLNNLIRDNSSNQVLLKETIGFEPLVSILKLRRGSAYNFTQQKTINLLKSMETVNLLLISGQDSELVNDSNRSSNQTVLAQNKLLDHLLMLGVESQWASVLVRCSALRCIGNLVRRNPQNLDALASRLVGEERHAEPALNSILRIILCTSVVEEFIAADYVFRCFCEKNPDGQVTLASTMTPMPNSNTEDDGSLSFGSMLLQTLVTAEGTEGLETCCRAASVLSHILKDNNQCKDRVLKIVLDAHVPSLGAPEPLLHRIVKHLACATPKKNKNNEETTGSSEVSYIQPVILHLLITWLADCPNAVNCILDSPAHLTYLIELISNENSSVSVRGFVAFVLGECVVYNKSSASNRDAFSVVDAISQKIGLTAYFMNFDELKKLFLFLASSHSAQERKPMMRSSSASMIDMEEVEMDDNATDQKHEHPILLSIFDPSFLNFIRKLEVDIRERIVEVYGQTKNKVATVPAELEQKDGENVSDYVKRLKSFVEKQCHEMQDLLVRNSTLADELIHAGSNSSSDSTDRPSNTRERIESESLRTNLQEATRHIEILKSEKSKMETEANSYKNLAGKLESDLKSLSDAYNSLEQENIRLESEAKILRKGGNVPYPNVEEIKEKAREEAQKESEAELNDLLVCLGQEQSKVEKLSSRLEELGEDVESLVEGIGDDAALLDEDEIDEEEN